MSGKWPVRALGDVCQIVGGGTPTTTVAGYWDGQIPWVSPKDMKSSLIHDSADHISEEAIRNSAASLVPEGSALVVVRSGILARTVPVALTGREIAINQDIKAIQPGSAILSRYLYYFLEASQAHLLSRVSRGATVHRLGTDALSSLAVSLPPTPEQRRIVGVLDKAFVAISVAKTNAEKKLENARALFDSYLSAAVKDAPVMPLGDIVESISTGPFGTMLHKSDYVHGGIPLVNPIGIVGSKITALERMRVSEKTRSRLQAYVLRAGDIVIARRGDLGRCAVVTENEEGWLCGTGSFFVRVNGFADRDYIAAMLRSPAGRRWLDANGIGATLKNLNHEILARMPIPVPPVETQRSVMAKGRLLLERVASLELNFQRKLAALDELKKSLLHEAFNGRL